MKKLSILFLFTLFLLKANSQENDYRVKPAVVFPIIDSLDIQLINSTFLGNSERNYYGNQAPSRLDVLWKFYLGKGRTTISRRKGDRIWAGAGWTGQPLLFTEKGKLMIVQGAFDHHLYKIDVESLEPVWKYKYDDVIKGTGTIWENLFTDTPENAYVILQGSRLGVDKYLDTRHVPSYRGISLVTGMEMWRHDSKWTDSYSRDVDASALILNDTAYIGLENALFTVFDPDYKKACLKDGMLQPKIYYQEKLYRKADVVKHKFNIVTEASPCLLGDRIYVSSGSGHVYGYNMASDSIDWDFYIGSDMDGSPVVTSDSCLIVTVEKQYIEGKGGVFKLDPSKKPAESVVWYFPTQNKDYAGWEGGVIGSAAVNDRYVPDSAAHLATFAAIDGYLYVVDHRSIDTLRMVIGPDNNTLYPAPKTVYKRKTGPSISTPIFVNDKLIAAGYGFIYLFRYDDDLNFELLDRRPGQFESTPVAHDGRIYIPCRDGYLYCYGEKYGQSK